MTAMTLPAKPWTNGMLTADQRYQYDSTVGAEGAWRANPLPVGGLPAGSIIQWSSNTPPANWLICDGSAVSRTVYSSLFAVIGTTYGTGDGSTTFNLPDLRGRVPVGKNGGSFGTLASTGGAETHTLSVNEMPSHTHVQNAHTHTQNAHNHSGGDYGHSHAQNVTANEGGPAWRVDYVADRSSWTYSQGTNTGASYASIYINNTTATNQDTTATNQNTGGGQAHNNLQPYLVVNYIIKATAGWTAGDSELATRVGAVETWKNKPGHVIQVQQTVVKTDWSSSAVGFSNVTGLSVSITPSSANSKILLTTSFSFAVGGFSYGPFLAFKFTGGNTANGIGSTAPDGVRNPATLTIDDLSGQYNGSMLATFSYLDSPATTSAVTYQVQAGRQYSPHTGTLYLNRYGFGIMTITATEVTA